MASDEDEVAKLARAHAASKRQWKAYREGKRRELPDAFAPVYNEVMAYLESMWNETSNALWVWRAIQFAWQPRGELALPLPTWCIAYLATAADQICRLCRDNDLDEQLGEQLHGSRTSGRHHQSAVPSAEEAADQVLRIFGLRRPGRNAFAEFRKGQQRDQLEVRYARMLSEGMSRSAAREALLLETGRSDDRELRRLLRKVKVRTHEGETE